MQLFEQSPDYAQAYQKVMEEKRSGSVGEGEDFEQKPIDY
jgi:hypothetical protein